LRPRKKANPKTITPIASMPKIKENAFKDVVGFSHFQNDFKNSLIKQLLAKGILSF
jgi:hypothetical protein